ncbi:hypothetical protein OEA41_010726 [Lepraria neglecta]|uniref:Uncharacterized protein n=1 Tax=Lepraria neglecta TaxID=209136 RepID=A0AAD9YX48_9LECA|nr:hypothetical protein OEA41_010726 [Lepraria neglecta]
MRLSLTLFALTTTSLNLVSGRTGVIVNGQTVTIDAPAEPSQYKTLLRAAKLDQDLGSLDLGSGDPLEPIKSAEVYRVDIRGPTGSAFIFSLAFVVDVLLGNQASAVAWKNLDPAVVWGLYRD